MDNAARNAQTFKKWIKTLHIVLIAVSLGGTAAMLVITLAGGALADPALSAGFDRAALAVFNWGVNWPFYGVLATSFAFALFTDWGFFRQSWITAKWAIVAAMFALTMTHLGPAVNGLASLSDSGLHAGAEQALYASIRNQTVLLLGLFLALYAVLCFLPVFKPGKPSSAPSKVKRIPVLIVLGVLILSGMAMAMMQASYLNSLRAVKVNDTVMTGKKDGVYAGAAELGGYVYRAEVTVSNHFIVSIRAISNRQSPYARYSEGVFLKIIKKQNANCDAVTGATTTSKAFMKAVEDALK